VACVADVMCYACNSYMAQCNYDKLVANTNNNVFQARCTSKCFTRQGEDDGELMHTIITTTTVIIIIVTIVSISGAYAREGARWSCLPLAAW